MRVDDANDIVRAAGVNQALYSFEGSGDEVMCILAEGQTWKVFLRQRNRRYEEQSFISEDEACVEFLKRLFLIWRIDRSIAGR